MIRFIGFFFLYTHHLLPVFFNIQASASLNMHQFPCPRDIVMAMEVKLADKQKYLMPKFVVGLLMIVSYLPAILSTDQVSQRSNCDLFRGEWIRNPSPPPYTDTSCRFIHEGQKCAYNGRPDTGYLHWRWKPYNCDLPQFDPKKFLTAMRDKSWGMIGDSLLRNQMQSMLCLLSKVHLSYAAILT